VVPAGNAVKIWAGPEVIGAGCCAKAAVLTAIANATVGMIFLIIFRPLLLMIERGDQDDPKVGPGSKDWRATIRPRERRAGLHFAAPIDTGALELFFSRVLAAFLMRLFRVNVCRL
jgi:hypothetical protein